MLEFCAQIDDIGAASWTSHAGNENPFINYDFLAALEDSGSVGGDSGWYPRHVLWRQDGDITGCAPAYIKVHSYGEYVFDQAWAHGFEQAGGRYYPKLQICAPFSPIAGPRLLAGKDRQASFADEIAHQTARMGLSSTHITFMEEDDYMALTAQGNFLGRLGLQYHWQNHGYRDFDDFLSALSSRKRKAIKRERQEAQAQGLDFITKRGAEITLADWRDFFRFYQDTSDRKWGSPYLTENFFPLIGQRLGDRVILMLAQRQGRNIAGALNLLGGDRLYGRHWGCIEEHKFLHFELCYYQALDFAIRHGLRRVEAGAQGEHKIQRGYLPQFTYSAHYIAHRGLRRAVADFLQAERDHIAQMKAELLRDSPYRGDGAIGA